MHPFIIGYMVTDRVWLTQSFMGLPEQRLYRNGSIEQGNSERTDLVASHFLRNIIQCLYYTQPQLLPLLILRHSNILDMSY